MATPSAVARPATGRTLATVSAVSQPNRSSPRPLAALCLKLCPTAAHHPPMDATDAIATADATLAELIALSMRAARVVTHLLEVEAAAVDVAATGLPEAGRPPASLAEAAAEGQTADAVAAAMAQAVPRAEILARALDRLSRSVRRSIALRQRLQAGWPRAGSDNRATMVRRQVARGVADRIRQQAEGEAAERLFDELAERLDDPALAEDLEILPVEQLVRRICCDIGLVAAALSPLASELPYRSRESERTRPKAPPA